MVTWDVEEPAATDPRVCAETVLAAGRPGSIILIHPMYRGGDTARAALPLILAGLRQRGLKPVGVGALIAAGEVASRR